MRQKIIKDTVIIFSSELISKIVAFIISIIVARYLGNTLFGIFSFAIAFTGIFGILSDFGQKAFIKREIARDLKSSNKLLVDSLVAKIFISATSLTVLFILVKLLNYAPQKEFAIYIAGIATLILSFSDHLRSVFQAHGKMAYSSLISIGRNILRFLLTFIMLNLGYGLFSVLAALLMSIAIELIISYIVLHFKIEKIKLKLDLKNSKNLLFRAIPFGFSSIFILIYYKIDITMLSFMANDQVVGWYSAAYNIIEGLLFIPLAFTTAITPLASQLFLKSISRMKALCVESLNYMAMISFPVAVGTAIISTKIISLIYGTEYLNSGLALAILIWSIIPTFIHYVLGLFVVSTNNEKQGMLNTGSCAILNIVLNFILIPYYGLVGAAIATIITEFFLVFMNYRVLCKVFKDFNILKNIYKPVLASIVMSIIFYIRNWNIFLVIGLGTIIYVFTLFLIGGISTKDFGFISQIIMRKFNANK
jgi:O-antigen/teichoic acid export membrane protein